MTSVRLDDTFISAPPVSLLLDDMVESQRIVADHLGIDRFAAVIGSSLGGMQALMWAVRHPTRVGSLISMAASASVPVASVAWHLIGRKLIQSDPEFRGGDYYTSTSPLRGVQFARMVGHMTYLSNEALDRKFGRRRRGGTRQFEVDSYLEHQGQTGTSASGEIARVSTTDPRVMRRSTPI